MMQMKRKAWLLAAGAVIVQTGLGTVCHCADTGVCVLPAGECNSVGSQVVTPLAEKVARHHKVIRQDAWFGGRRTVFDFRGYEAWVVEPPEGVAPAAGRPWTWTMQWKTAFVVRSGVPEMLRRGFHHATIDTFALKMDAEGLKISKAFQDYLVKELGFAPKTSLVGMSWGGFFSVRYAATYPESVDRLYLDNPLLDFGTTFRDDIGSWNALRPLDGNWTASPEMPVNKAEAIAGAKIPVLLCYGSADTVTRPEVNALPFADRVRRAGGNLRLVCRPLYGHHPHGMEAGDTTVVDFLSQAAFVYAYNEDDGMFFGQMPAEGYKRHLDEVCRGPITHFMACPNSMRSNVDSKVFDPIWMALDERALGVIPDGRCTAGKWMHERGVDPYAAYCEQARARGLSGWISMRMNDIHWVTKPSYCALSRFWRRHPEFRRVTTPAVPDGGWNWGDYAFDYSHREVRDYHVGYARELLGRYDLDGFEADWLRSCHCLTPGKAREQSACLDDVMREIRRAADAAARRLGHPVRVAARVPGSLAVARDLGFDVRTWACERLVDVLVPCNDFRTIDFSVDYAEWDALKRLNPNLQIVVGVDAGIAKEFLPEGAPGVTPRALATKAEYRGWAERLYAVGCEGVYFFNLFQHPMDAPDGVYNWVLNGGLRPERLAAGGKRVYVLTQSDFLQMVEGASLKKAPGFFGPLPCDLGKPVELTIGIGRPRPGDRIRVRVAFDSESVPSEASATVRLNGVAAATGESVPVETWIPKTRYARSSVCCSFPPDAIRAGANRIAVGGGLPGVKAYACELELDDGKED